jgi:hypothetical protein
MSKNRKHEEDKFYTKRSAVELLIKNIDIENYDLIIEPSAGDGSFLDFIDKYNYIALDISPEDSRIVKYNWFDFKLDVVYNKILVIGNPPFGNQGNLAIEFIKKSAELNVDTIAFILPKSFKKHTIQNRIPLNYHLENEIDMKDDSYTLLGVDYSVPSVFQIWKKRNKNRSVIKLPTTTNFFDFVNKSDDPNISFRRVGFYAGRIYDEVSDKSEQSHYFIKENGKLSIFEIKKILNGINWKHDNTAGPRSIGKGELIAEFEKRVI